MDRLYELTRQLAQRIVNYEDPLKLAVDYVALQRAAQEILRLQAPSVNHTNTNQVHPLKIRTKRKVKR